MSTGKNETNPKRIWPALTSAALIVGAGTLLVLGIMKGKTPQSSPPAAVSTQQMAQASSPAPAATSNLPAKAEGTNRAPQTAVDLENKAVELMSEGHVDEALAYLNRAVKMNPDDETTHFNLA